MKKEYMGDDVHLAVEGGDLMLTKEDTNRVWDSIRLQPHVLKELLAYIEEWQKEPVKS